MFVNSFILSHDVIVSQNVTKAQMKGNAGKTQCLQFKKDTQAFFDLFKDSRVVIFTAGEVTCVKIMMEASGYSLKGIEVFGNEMLFDEADKCIGFKDVRSDSFCKNIEILPKDQQPREESKRFLLIGDSIGDADMIRDDQLKPGQQAFRIGLINADTSIEGWEKKAQQALESYKKKGFDLIIFNDCELTTTVQELKKLQRMPSQ